MILRLVDENYKLFVFSICVDSQCIAFTKCFSDNVKAFTHSVTTFTAYCNGFYFGM